MQESHFTHIDAHTHTQFAAYDKDREAVIARAHTAGIAIVNVGSDAKMSEAAVALAKRYAHGVYATVGLHPTDTKEGFDRAFYEALARDEKVVAIGECGLDFFRIDEKNEAEKEAQRELFLAQLELAHGVQKPLMIHCRNAMPELIALLKEHEDLIPRDSIMHFFSGTADEAKELLTLGFNFTFGGVITFVHEYDEAIRAIPIEHLLSETDAPYVTPVPYRGTRNEPSYVLEVEKRLAELKGVSVDVMAAAIVTNAERIFKISLS